MLIPGVNWIGTSRRALSCCAAASGRSGTKACLPIFHNHYHITTILRYRDDGLAELRREVPSVQWAVIIRLVDIRVMP